MIANLFQKIDGFLFEQMLKLKTSPAFSKVQETFNELDDHIQRIIKYILIALAAFLPLVIALVFFISVKSSESQIDKLKESLQRVDHYLDSRRKLRSTGGRFLAPNPINSQSQFVDRIGLAVNTHNIDLANIQANDFSSEVIPGDIVKSIIAIKFKQLSSDQLFGMLLTLSTSYFVKFENIEITRSKENNLLEGIVSLNHFSKAAQNDN